MEHETTGSDKKDCCSFRWYAQEHVRCHGCGSAVYWLGFLGSLVYYITTATSLWAGIVGVVKAFLWPAFLVYSAMKSLGM